MPRLKADAGHGGNIRIAASQFIKSYESFVSASSRLGLDGDVEIDSPNENITEGILTLSSEMVDVGHMMKKSCDAMTYKLSFEFDKNVINNVIQIFSQKLSATEFNLQIKSFGSITQARKMLEHIETQSINAVILMDLDTPKEKREERLHQYQPFDTNQIFL